jgi:hypothetical protein
MRNLGVRSLLLGLGFVLGLATVSCSEEDQSCVAGKACVCESDCSLACEDEGGECEFECRAGAACEFDCPGGGCAVACQGDSCILDCAGNECTMSCSSAATTCEIRGCTSMCGIQCNGAQGCQVSCGLEEFCGTSP